MAQESNERRRRREDDEYRDDDNQGGDNHDGKGESARGSSGDQGRSGGQGRPHFSSDRRSADDAGDDQPADEGQSQAEYGPAPAHSHRADADAGQGDFRPSKEVWSPTFSSHTPSPLLPRPEGHSHSRDDDEEDLPHPRHTSSSHTPHTHTTHAHAGHTYTTHPAHQPVAGPNGTPAMQGVGYQPRPAAPIIPSSTLARAAALDAVTGGSPSSALPMTSPGAGSLPLGSSPASSLLSSPLASGSGGGLPTNPYAMSPDNQPMLIAMGTALLVGLGVIGALVYRNTPGPNENDPRNTRQSGFQQGGHSPQMGGPVQQQMGGPIGGSVQQMTQMPQGAPPAYPQQQTYPQPGAQPVSYGQQQQPPVYNQAQQPADLTPQQAQEQQEGGDASDLLALQQQLSNSNNQPYNQSNNQNSQFNQQLSQQQTLASQQQENARLQQENARLEQLRQNQQLASAQQQQQQLQQQQTLLFQQQSTPQSPEALQRKYVTDVRLAAQAWERGDTNQVLQLLSPYRTAELRPQFNGFAGNYLWRAAHNGSSSTLRGHADVVRQVAFLPDGSRVATMADDATINLWDAASGRSIASVAIEKAVPPATFGAPIEDQYRRRASGLAITANGAWVAAYGQNLYFGTNIGQSDQVRRVTDHPAPITALAVSPRGDIVASSDLMGNVLIHRMIDGSTVTKLAGTRPQALAFSPDGKFIYAGMQDGNMFVWDATTGALQGTAAFGDGINSVAVSPDGSIVAVAMAMRDGVVRLWEPTTGKVRGELRGHHDEVTHVTYSRDGRSLLTSSRDQTACLWNNTGGLLRTFRGHIADVETVAFSPNGQKVVSAGDDHTAILWNVDGGQACDILADTPVDGWVSGFAFTPDGSQLVGTGSCDNNEAYLMLWNLASNNRPTPLQTGSKSGVALAFSPDGRQMVVGESSSKEATVRSRVRFWSLEPIRVTASFPPATQMASVPAPKLMGSIHSASYSPDGRYVAIGLGDIDERFPATVKIFDAATGTLRAELPEAPGQSQAYFTPDGQFLVVATTSKKRPGDVRVWSLAQNRIASQFTVPQGLEGMIAATLSPDGQFLVTSHGDLMRPQQPNQLRLRVWNIASKQMVGEFPAVHPAPVTQMVFTRLGRVLATADVAGNVRVWDFASRRPLPRQIPQQAGEISCMAFDVPGNRLIIGANEKSLRVWNVDTGAQLAVMELAMGKPTAVRVSEDNRTIAAATSAGGLFFWDCASYQPRSILRGEGNPAGAAGHGSVITCVAGPMGDGRILTASTDKTVKIWDIRARAVADKPLAEFKQSIMCMALSPNGRNVVVGSGRYKHEFEPGQLVSLPLDGQTQPQILRGNVAISNVAYSPDGTTLAVCSLSSDVGQIVRRDASLVDPQSGRSTPLASKLPHCVGFSPDGRLLAIGCMDGRVEIWPVGGQLPSAPYGSRSTGGYGLLNEPSGVLRLVGYTGYGNGGYGNSNYGSGNNYGNPSYPAASGFATPTPQGTILPNVGLPANGLPTAPIGVLQAHRGMVSVVAFAPDGRTLATGGADNNVVLWDVPTGQDLITFKHNGSVEGLKFSADGTLLATADREPTRGGVRVWRSTVDDSTLDNAPGLSSPAISAGTSYGTGPDPHAAVPAAANPGYPDRRQHHPRGNPPPQ